MDHQQDDEIETMRARLHELVMVKGGNMIDPEVSQLSVELDNLIVKDQKKKIKQVKKSV